MPSPTMPNPTCPVCGGTRFGEHNGRPTAACAGCGSLERGRYLWMLLKRLGLPEAGSTVVHFAPERFLFARFSGRRDITYEAYDKFPEAYPYGENAVRPFDLCTDTGSIRSESCDLIIHNHVLEHVPCKVEDVLAELKRMLRPGGSTVFSVPFRGDETAEDLDPGLSGEERRARFAQADHMRIFGRFDFVRFLDRHLGGNCLVDPCDVGSREEMIAAAIPPFRAGEVSGNSLFHYRKPD